MNSTQEEIKSLVDEAKKEVQAISNPTSTAAKIVAWTLLALLLLACAAAVYSFFNKKPIPNGTPAIAEEIKGLGNIPKVGVELKSPLQVYEKEGFLKKVNVPNEVSLNKNNQFTTTGIINPAPYGGKVVSFTNISSGKSGLTIELNKRPFFAFPDKKDIGVYVGISNKGPVVSTEGRWSFFRIGPVFVDAKVNVSVPVQQIDKTLVMPMVGIHTEW